MPLKNQYTKLNPLHDEIEKRVQTIRSEQPDWLCRQGCDGCCHRLADVPRLTAPEWTLLKAGLSALPPAQFEKIRQDIAALANNPTRPIVCPMLDKAAGSCRVYAHRPIACRTYGFYVQRDLGLYCQDIETQVADGALAEVVWGNHDVIDARLAELGESRELPDWLARWQE
jgi:Fe-S-cluster containining protein